MSSASGTIAWAQVAVLAKPKAGAQRVAVLNQFRPDFRPQYVLALEAVRTKSGQPTWYRISVPGRPNGRTGWVRAAALELQPVQKRVVIYRGARKFEFWDGARLVRSGKVAVGAPGAETPLGLFYVTDKFDPAIDPDWAILGAYAFETSAYSKLTDWPGRRDRRRARHAVAEPPRAGRLARLHPLAQPRRRVPAQPRPARDAGQDRSLRRGITCRRRTVPRVKET